MHGDSGTTKINNGENGALHYTLSAHKALSLDRRFVCKSDEAKHTAAKHNSVQLQLAGSHNSPTTVIHAYSPPSIYSWQQGGSGKLCLSTTILV